MERTFLRREHLALTFLSYCIIVIFARSLVFFAQVSGGVGPQFILSGIHIHHFVYGIVLLLAALLIHKKSAGGRCGLRAMMVGSGLGLVLDETSLWLPPGPDGYWAVQNLLLVVVVGAILMLRVFPVPLPLRRKKPLTSAAALPARPAPHKNPENPYLSVVVPAYNEGQLLNRTLESLLGQSYKDFELIVVDNNSSDNTADVARSFGAIVIREERQGVSHARQRGFMEARGQVIATTDADTVVPAGWLARIAHEFKKNDDLAAFGGLYTLYSGPITARLAIAYLSLPAWKMDRFFCRGWSLPGANLAVRSSTFRKIGGFNTRLKLCEDVDLSHRLKALGRVVLDPKFLVSTSGRRFRNGFLRGMSTYGPNAAARMLFKKHKFDRLPTIRGEGPLARKLAFAPALAALIFLFSMYYVSNPKIAESRPVAAVMSQKSFVVARVTDAGRQVMAFFTGGQAETPSAPPGNGQTAK
ncbi:MAG: glycosyltransferase [Chloroflexi bacterium]|nr:glycosyltransferase [Chloroflexota bacterium]